MNAVEVVQHANKAYNAHDLDALAAAYAEGATYSDSRDGQVFTGKEIANYAKAVWAAYPDASVELITVADTGGGLVAAQWVLRGTTPTGRTVTVPGASFTQVEGDKIRSEQTYFDRQNLLEQLGQKVRATSNTNEVMYAFSDMPTRRDDGYAKNGETALAFLHKRREQRFVEP